MRKDKEFRDWSQFEYSFYLKQLSDTGLPGPEDPRNFMRVKDTYAEPPARAVYEMPIFWPDENGNMVINFADLEGNRYWVQAPDRKNKKPIYYAQTRLQYPNVKQKYSGPKGVTPFPFIPPLVRESWREITTLTLTEGAKKAFRLALAGIPAIGLSSITTAKDKKAEATEDVGNLHGDVVRILREGSLSQFVICFDNDCTDIAKNQVDGEDLAKRPRIFFSQISQIRALVLAEKPDLQVLFFYPNGKDFNYPKGADDLLNAAAAAGQLSEVVDEFSGELSATRYWAKFDITTPDQLENLRSFFAIRTKDADKFYNRHAEAIGSQRFKFNGKLYQYNTEKGEVEGEGKQENNPFILMRDFVLNRYEFRRNIVANAIEMRLKGTDQWRELGHLADILTELWEAGFKTDENKLTVLLRSRKYVPEHDPFIDYFENLPPWDGIDHIGKLSSFLITLPEHRDFVDRQFKKALVRMVAMATLQIPFNKHCIIIQAPGQNQGKTTFVRYLIPPALSAYKVEHLDTTNKDGRLTLAQNFVINLDEISEFKPQDLRSIKNYFTLDLIRERPVFEKTPANFPRRATFWASTDKTEFLVDETGNTRWVVLPIISIQHDHGGPEGYHQVNIESVYSQAVALLDSGFDFRVKDQDLAESEANNANFIVSTTEREMLETMFLPAHGKDHVIDLPTTRDGREQILPQYPKFFRPADIIAKLETRLKTVFRPNVTKAIRLMKWEKVKAYFPAIKQSRDGYWLFELEDLGAPEGDQASDQVAENDKLPF